MCGICGVFQINGPAREVVAPEVLDAMTDVMTHRGPNDRGTEAGPGFALGARRLSIIDVDGGHQPVTDERRAIIAVQNGELYNHTEIRRELERAGHSLRSRCDTEILPHLYEDVGDAVPERLRGKFGLAVWDRERRRGLVARDRLGVKPVYYAHVGDLVVFASELKSVLASGLVPLDLDPEAIDLYLSLGFLPGPRTPLLAVKKLLPGHRLRVGEGDVRVEQYWSYPAPAPDAPALGDDEYAEQLLSLLDDAVESRLMSDVPIGLMLSGGLDSSLVLALMARRLAEPVKTFSVGFAGTPDNELAAARSVAQAFGADHHQLELSLDDPIDLDGLVWSLDEPLADLSALGFRSLSALAADHVTVALAGQGADELLAGYGSRYRRLAQLERWRRVPAPLRRAGWELARRGPARARRAAQMALAEDPLVASLRARTAWNCGFRTEAAVGALAAVDSSIVERVISERLPEGGGHGLGRALFLDAQLGLVDDMLHYFDRTSMAHSLEVRIPFLDHRVVEFCARIPDRLKMERGVTKVVLRRIARGLVPDEVIDRPKIGFFHSSVEHWFRAQLSGVVADVLFDPGARYTTLLDRGAVERLVRGGRADYRSSRMLLAVLMLELWLSEFLPRAVGASRRPAAAVAG